MVRAASRASPGTVRISQVLSISRRQMVEPTRFELREAIRELAPLLERSHAPGQTPRLLLPDELGPVYADQTRLGQALLNLAINGRDAMPDGGILTMEAGQVTLEAGAIAILDGR